MNIQQAKQIPLREILTSAGWSPVKEIREELWYISPLRPEKSASFKVSTGKNLWYDHGSGEGGNGIDLVQKLYGLAGVSEVLKKLEQVMGGSALPPSKAPEIAEIAPKEIKILQTKSIQHPALKSYLQARKIPFALAETYLKEIHYQVEDKQYFGLGIQNQAGGWELRSSNFKGCMGKKDLILIDHPKTEKLLVFEGAFDFLSMLAHFKKEAVQSPVLILGSVAMRKRALERIQATQPIEIFCFLDNDCAGAETLDYFKTQLPETKILDKSDLYKPHKDFNEFLVN